MDVIKWNIHQNLIIFLQFFTGNLAFSHSQSINQNRQSSLVSGNGNIFRSSGGIA